MKEMANIREPKAPRPLNVGLQGWVKINLPATLPNGALRADPKEIRFEAGVEHQQNTPQESGGGSNFSQEGPSSTGGGKGSRKGKGERNTRPWEWG